jgi:glycine/D-amino acid oxidase-like deaminating enzyme
VTARKRIVVIGAGVVGLCVAHYARQRGHEVAIVERERDGGDSCSLGNAGLISPSHFVPLAEPSKIWKALTSFLDSRSPFYLKPRLDLDLVRWGLLFLRASLPARAARSAPVLRDLMLASRALHLELAAALDDAQRLETRACSCCAAARPASTRRRTSRSARGSSASTRRSARLRAPPSSTPARACRSSARCTTPATRISCRCASWPRSSTRCARTSHCTGGTR